MVKIIFKAFGNALSDFKTEENIEWLKPFALFGLLGFTGAHRFIHGKIKGGIIMFAAFALFVVAHLFDGMIGFKNMTSVILGFLLLADFYSFIKNKYVIKDEIITNSFSYEIGTIFFVIISLYLEIIYFILFSFI